MGRKKKEQQQESLKQNPVNETPEDGDSAEYEEMPDQSEQIMQTGSVTVTRAKHVIHCLTIVGQIEGHYILPPQNKTTKYEHVIPQLVAIEQDPSIEGLMIILNTVGGDVEAGLAIAELISGMKLDRRAAGLQRAAVVHRAVGHHDRPPGADERPGAGRAADAVLL